MFRRPLRASGPETSWTHWGPIWSTPNLITALRLALVPPFLATYLSGALHAAVLLFAIAALSDIVDGTLARLLGQRTRVGALLDPVADKVLGLAALSVLVAHRQLPVWLLGLSLTRDVVVLTVGLALRASRQGEVAVVPSRFGKYATFFTNTAVILALLGQITYAPRLAGFVLATAYIAAECLVVAATQYAGRFVLFSRRPAR
ncbi:MAG: CDP-alcohol phosphatidyltransferase family protein [Myxococcales bacterium]